jgi:hypothetical protein
VIWLRSSKACSYKLRHEIRKMGCGHDVLDFTVSSLFIFGKSQTLMCLTAITAFAALAIAQRRAAQDAQEHNTSCFVMPSYKHLDTTQRYGEAV